jgi:hypothetical protein
MTTEELTIRECPSWCRGHSDQLHFGDDCFEGTGDSEDDHGMVLTLVEPWTGPDIVTGDSVWIPERLRLSLFINAGALLPTVSFDGPSKPFQLSLSEAQRLADALAELIDEAWKDAAERGPSHPAPAIEESEASVMAQ